jgi:vacuolar-type H+-ATPase subunit I/STV1
VPARFAASASGGGGGEYKSEEEERREREAEMRRRLKEAEEMDELERTAEELQSRASAVDESEEEKRERVRRELQKVPTPPRLNHTSIVLPSTYCSTNTVNCRAKHTDTLTLQDQTKLHITSNSSFFLQGKRAFH